MALIERIDLQTRVAGEKAYASDEFVTFSQITAGTGIELTQASNRDIQINVTGTTTNDYLKRSASDYATFDLGTLATSDIFLVEDVDDSYNKKKVTVQDVIDLVPSSGSNMVNFYEQSTLDIDGDNGDYFIIELATDDTFTFDNIVTGKHYFFLVKHNGVGSDPIEISIPIDKEITPLTSIEVTAAHAIEIAMLSNGTWRIWQFSDQIEVVET